MYTVVQSWSMSQRYVREYDGQASIGREVQVKDENWSIVLLEKLGDANDICRLGS